MDLTNPLVAYAVNEWVFPIVGIVISGAVTWAAAQFHKRTGVKIELDRRTQLHNAATTAVKAVLSDLVAKGRLPSSQNELADIIRSVPTTIKKMNPDAVKALKATEEDLRKIAMAKATDLIATVAGK